MKCWSLLLVLLALIVLFNVEVNAEIRPMQAKPEPVGEKAFPRILVTFSDEAKNRVPVVNTVSPYRARGNYRNSTWSKNIAVQLSQQYGLRLLTQWPISALGIHCIVYEVSGTQSVDQLLRVLERDERVASAQAVQTFHTLSESYNDPYLKLQTDMASMHIAAAHQFSTGRHNKIAVIDSGIDENHPDLHGQIVLTENYAITSGKDSDAVHGTAVAGIIAAIANNGKGIVGVAPGASLLSLQACWGDGSEQAGAICDTFTLSQALNAAINLHADIINLSLTGPKDALLERLIDKALDQGIIVVAADPALTGANEDFPASMPRVIAVRSAGARNATKTGDERAVAAPGEEILTTLPQDSYNFMSGSSFAAAHVSGVIALLLEINPQLTAQQIRWVLQAAMNHFNSRTIGTIDAAAAIARIRDGEYRLGLRFPAAKDKGRRFALPVRFSRVRLMNGF